MTKRHFLLLEVQISCKNTRVKGTYGIDSKIPEFRMNEPASKEPYTVLHGRKQWSVLNNTGSGPGKLFICIKIFGANDEAEFNGFVSRGKVIKPTDYTGSVRDSIPQNFKKIRAKILELNFT